MRDPLTPYRSPAAPRKSKRSSGSKILPWTIMIAGFGWALLGAVILFGIVSDSSGDENGRAIAFIVDMVFFILPGLAVGGLGLRLHRRD